MSDAQAKPIELPPGWLAPRSEIVIEEPYSGRNSFFTFVPARVTAVGGIRVVAQCQSCRGLVEPDQESLRLHGFRHILLHVPFDAKGDIRV